MARLNLLPAALLALAAHVTAQTSTDCNPLKQSCSDDPALGTTFDTVFDSSMTEFDPQLFTIDAGTDLISFTDEGAELTISNSGESVTIQTAFYVFFGQIEVLFKAASGQGIISTFDLLSDDLDEIDVEIMGGNTSFTSTNYYGWGNTNQFNTLYIPSTGGSWGTQGAMGAVHNYTINWTQDTLEWIFDGDTVRTVPYEAAGKWPQTPSFLKFGIWAGGDSTEPPGTIKWAGGPVDWSSGPFTMTVQSIKMIDGHQNVASYSYGDKSGTYESINTTPGQSDALKAINGQSTPGTSTSGTSSSGTSSSGTSTSDNVVNKWNGLSTTAKIAIGCGILGVFVIALILFTFYCIKQRRAGKREKVLADQAWDAQQAELLMYRNRMKRGDFAVGYMGHGEKF